MSEIDRLAAQYTPPTNGQRRNSYADLPPDDIAYLNVTNGDLANYDAYAEDPIVPPAAIVTWKKLREDFPELNPPIINGILRKGETSNLISTSKAGKSWLVHGLALSGGAGRNWLDTFPVQYGKVLVIDNELHKPTLASRINTVADAMGIDRDEAGEMVHLWPIRGQRLDIFAIANRLESFRDRYTMIILDAKYRAMPPGTSENDNASESAYYSEIDRLAEELGVAWINIHHSSKGNQGDKRVTDVGSGAGAQSRAADSHLILREHEEDGVAVLDCAIRSFAPVDPIGLRWEFPLWVRDDSIDVGKLRGKQSRGEEKQGQQDIDADRAVLDACKTWSTRTEIKKRTGFGETRRDRAIARLLGRNYLEQGKEDRRGNPGSEVFRKTIHAG